ncbi:MAG: hypothetical protein LBT55_00080 [Clostridiaceae bacterium]|nr:hypothetical protein [Clostridiaceae bacterium]
MVAVIITVTVKVYSPIKLSVPAGIVKNGEVIEWDKSDGAERYLVEINGEEYDWRKIVLI